MHVTLQCIAHLLRIVALHFGVAKPQYVLLLPDKKYVCRKKIVSRLDSNLVPWLVRPQPYPVSYWEVLIGLHMLLLTRTKIGHNFNLKA